jgi:hypothetical protein
MASAPRNVKTMRRCNCNAFIGGPFEGGISVLAGQVEWGELIAE